MTISSTTPITSPLYIGNSTTAIYSFPFVVNDKNHVTVYQTDTATGIVTKLVVDVDYTVSGLGGSGSITLLAGNLSTGQTLYIRSNFELKQSTGFATQGSFSPQIHEDAFDYQMYSLKQLNDLIARSIRFPDSYAGTVSAELPTPIANKSIVWNATADGLENGLSGVEITQAVTDAQTAQTAAEAAQAGAELILDTFDDRYLGEKAADPTVDNDGNPLQVGAEYWNNVANERRTWTGTSWIVSGASTASGIINVPAGNVSSTDVQGAINELDTEKVNTSDIGTTVQAYDADLDTLSANGFGVANGQAIQADATGLPVIDGSQLTNIGLGNGQTQQDVTASRAFNVNYTAPSRTIFVEITTLGSPTIAVDIYKDGVIVGGFSSPSSAFGRGSFIVPAGIVYKVAINSGSGSINKWLETR